MFRAVLREPIPGERVRHARAEAERWCEARRMHRPPPPSRLLPQIAVS